MRSLNLPRFVPRTRMSDGGQQIYDSIRARYVALTPEEWVRQSFLNYMVNDLGYPGGLIKVEAAFRLNSMLRRADILVYSRSGHPAMIVECKAPEVKINRNVFDQIINYNFNYSVRYIIVTNGIQHFAAEIDHKSNKISFLNMIPDFETVNRNGHD